MSKKNSSKKTAPQKKYRYYITAIIIIAIVALAGHYLYNQQSYYPFQESTIELTGVEDIALPEDWSETTDETNDKDVIAIYKKTSETELQPTVVVISAEIDETDTQTYVENLVQGTQKSIPSFTIESDETNETADSFTRTIDGYYLNGEQRINIYQQISVVNNMVYTLTASSHPDESELLKKDILAIFNYVYNNQILSQ